MARLLGVDEGAVKRDYEDTVRVWWERLRRWLEARDGGLGLPTWEAPMRGYHSIVGHAWSQVLVRAPDRSDFTEFFSTLGIADGSELELDPDAAPSELFARWKAWARLTGHVSARLAHVLDDRGRSDDVLGALVARILIDELLHWDGVVRDAQRVPIVQLVVTANTFDRHALEFAAVTPDLLAGRTIWLGDMRVDLGYLGDILPVPVPVSAEALGRGLAFDGPISIRYAPRAIVPLARRGADLWRSVSQLEPGEEAYALVSEKALHEFFSVVPEPRESQAVDNVPTGWHLFRDIEPSATSMQAGTDAFALIPRTSDLPHLRGGLRLSRTRRYLVSGLPDVVVPGVEGVSPSVTLDGALVASFGAEGGVVRLADCGVSPGEHIVTAGARCLRLAAVEYDWWDPPRTPELAHILAVGGGEETLDAVRAPRDHDTLFVAGATVHGRPAGQPVFIPVPDAVTLFGRPGEAFAAIPSHAPWAQAAQLPLVAFEPFSRFGVTGGRPFVPTWAVVSRAGSTEIVPLASELDLEPHGSPEQLRAWADAVLQADQIASPEQRADPLWREYVAVASVSRE